MNNGWTNKEYTEDHANGFVTETFCSSIKGNPIAIADNYIINSKFYYQLINLRLTK